MSLIIAMAIGLVIIGGGVVFIRWLRRPRSLDTTDFQERWRALQRLCANKKTWPDAITQADTLLDEVLKKKRFSGKNMGERLVKAQRLLTDNDRVWFGHKLRAKVDSQPKARLQEKAVKEALLGIRQALKDLGALPNDQPRGK